jgi:hypothetical protein
LVAACALALGCATAEPIHRPPRPAEIERLNEARWPLVVTLVPPAEPHDRTIDHVVSADATKILVAPNTDGSTYPLRLEDVSSFSTRRSFRGAAIGAGLGGGIGVLAAGVVILRSSFCSPPSGCGSSSREPVLSALFVPILASALIGAFIGTRHSFVLIPARDPYDPALPVLLALPELLAESDGPDSFPPQPAAPAPAASPAPPPPPQVAKRPASVVTPVAEVRSAPFDVAPVLTVLARGQPLFVAASPRPGWRVAILSDGRVGYVREAQVLSGAGMR